MNVLTKREATSAIVESLFHPGGSLACLPKERFDLGKYATNPAGHPVPDHMVPHVRIVWSERRKDLHGPYWALFSISARQS